MAKVAIEEVAMKRIGWSLLVIGALFFAGWGLRKTIWPSACDPGTSALVAHAYVLSIPLIGRENELVPYMNSASGFFAESGQATRCMQSVGAALVKKGEVMSNQFSGHAATERFGGRVPTGLEHLPGQVDSGLRSFGADTAAMGAEFLWLSQVLPAAAQGNYTPYNTTGTPARQTMRQVWPVYCRLDPQLCQMVQVTISGTVPALEAEIYRVVSASGN